MKPNGFAFGFRVLVVEEDESLRKIVAFLLSDHGYGCELAKNGVEALERVRQNRFDAVLTDMEMPEMDGIALTREIRRHFSDLPVLMMTSDSDDRYKETAVRVGAKGFLSKPFKPSDLIKRLHSILANDELA
jgi:two-component system chemotaxis response regulator CheY